MPELDPRINTSNTPIVTAVDIACVLFNREDLDKTAGFMKDFGLSTVEQKDGTLLFYAQAGYGPAVIAYKSARSTFRGIGLYVETRADLERLSELEGASDVEHALGYPEGLQVRLVDPAGNEVRAIHGPKPDPAIVRPPLGQNVYNNAHRINAFQRPPLRPSTVLRLGHAVLNVVDFFKTSRWYMDVFGLVPSDVQTIGDNEPVLVFYRCNRGDTPVDHHTLVVAQNVENTLGHCAFETIDIDDIGMGQRHLRSKGGTHAWGIGRHPEGSQIFDYWRGPSGDKFEHFCDSDQCTMAHQVGITPLSLSGTSQWGPEMPTDFEAPHITPAFAYRAIHNIRQSEEMTFARMRRLFQALSRPPLSDDVDP